MIARFGMVRAFAAVIAAGLCSVAGVAGAQASFNFPQPATAPSVQFKFPNINNHTLENGVRVLVIEDHSVPVVAVRAVLGADSASDPAGKEGLFSVTVGVLREGTTIHTLDQLTMAAADIGTTVTPTRFTTVTAAFPRAPKTAKRFGAGKSPAEAKHFCG